MRTEREADLDIVPRPFGLRRAHHATISRASVPNFFAAGLLPQLDEGLDYRAIAPAAPGVVTHDPERGVSGHRLAIRPVGRESVVDVDHRDDTREHRNRVAGQAVGVAAAVEPLVMVTDDRPHRVEGAHRFAAARRR